MRSITTAFSTACLLFVIWWAGYSFGRSSEQRRNLQWLIATEVRIMAVEREEQELRECLVILADQTGAAIRQANTLFQKLTPAAPAEQSDAGSGPCRIRRSRSV